MKRSELKRSGSLLRRTPMPQPTQPIRHRSARTERIYRTQRRPLVAALAAEAGICPVHGCTRRADSPHEPLTRARGGSIVDPANVVMVCHFHNEQISAEEPAWAYEQGLLKHSWDGDAA